ncbi:histidine phosphotransferase [Rubellimicrobium rubrum]|uniref:Histidine phosphotransferase n=1 Tax=Rubellimicrobium rubrum TaxID=2585369 RepID=A0A5C4N1I9_9RHOB|nr:histidine phosphotransferase family protein [Rubellimicrobium rubrum]TNC51215.1 histidine phosphotransferase [Rubellimicrobium rubrum]
MPEVHSLPKEGPGDTDLTALLAARICHDLTSPLGAIANGVELLALAGLETSPEMQLIAQSVESANARLRFFRLAFGLAGRQGIGSAEVTRILAALSRTGRIVYDWSVTGDVPRDEVKAVFLLLQCLESAMPTGGRIRVARQLDAWDLTAEGGRLRVDPMVWDSVREQRGTPPAASALVQFPLLAGVLDRLGRNVTLDYDGDRITVRM